MKLAAKHARRISELFNTITVSRQFTDDANCKTPEGRDVFVRWYDNALEATRELRDAYGITVPYWTERLDSPSDAYTFMHFMHAADKSAGLI